MKVERNDPCPCGSGKKYKKCCINKPDHLLIENLNSLMQEGYSLLEKGQEDKACDLWWELWQKTLKWIPPRQLAAIEELDKETHPYMSQSYHNWVQDFEMTLSQIGQKDVRFLEILHRYAREFRTFFPKSKSLILMNMGTAAGEALCQLDRLDEADALFEQLTSEKYKDEDMVWLYLRWGDLYTEWVNGGIIDHKRARSLYEKALELKLNESDREAVQERIKDIKD